MSGSRGDLVTWSLHPHRGLAGSVAGALVGERRLAGLDHGEVRRVVRVADEQQVGAARDRVGEQGPHVERDLAEPGELGRLDDRDRAGVVDGADLGGVVRHGRAVLPDGREVAVAVELGRGGADDLGLLDGVLAAELQVGLPLAVDLNAERGGQRLRGHVHATELELARDLDARDLLLAGDRVDRDDDRALGVLGVQHVDLGAVLGLRAHVAEGALQAVLGGQLGVDVAALAVALERHEPRRADRTTGEGPLQVRLLGVLHGQQHAVHDRGLERDPRLLVHRADERGREAERHLHALELVAGEAQSAVAEAQHDARVRQTRDLEVARRGLLPRAVDDRTAVRLRHDQSAAVVAELDELGVRDGGQVEAGGLDLSSRNHVVVPSQCSRSSVRPATDTPSIWGT